MSETETVPNVPNPPHAMATPAVPSAEERTWAMLGHLAAFSFFITGIGCIVGPLIVWLIKRDSMPFAGDQAREALNFNITTAIVCIALVVLSIVTLGLGLLLTVPAGVVIAIVWFVLTIVAAIKANEGVAYRYPFTLRLVS